MATVASSLVKAHRVERSVTRAWPAYLITLLVALAAGYSFSPRPLPPFATTQVHPDDLLVTGVAVSGERLVVAGEQGRILFADDAEGPWRAARVQPQRGSTLTQLKFVTPDTAIAVGHDGWILRSEDAGRSWREVQFNQGMTDPLLAIAGPYDGKLFAIGRFGLFYTSADEGRSRALRW